MAALEGLARRDQSDSDGSFSLHDVVPGNYILVAIEDGWELDWTQPQVIGRYLPGGIPVTVTDKEGNSPRSMLRSRFKPAERGFHPCNSSGLPIRTYEPARPSPRLRRTGGRG